MIEIINLKPSPVTPERILEIEIEYNGEIYSGFVIKKEQVMNDNTNNKS